MLVAHGERHHALIKSGLAEEGFWMAIDQREDLFAAALDLALK
jgi:hypothetical protein